MNEGEQNLESNKTDEDQQNKIILFYIKFILEICSLLIYLSYLNNYLIIKYKFINTLPHIISDLNIQIPVSVIIPIYNKYQYLNQCLNSVQNQTFNNIEITCIDDGSTDNSSNFIIERMKNDKRIKLIKNYYNKGLLLSRFFGILHSKGEYIMCLDADDYYYLDIIEKSYYYAKLYNSDILEFRVKALKHDKIISSFFPCYQNHSNNNQLLQILQKFHFTELNWILCDKIIKKSLYEKAYRIFYPFVENKKINNADDLIIYGTVLFYMKTFICTNFLGYFYFWTAPDNSKSGNYQSTNLNQIQLKYARNVISYFYTNRENLSNVNFDQFLKNSNNIVLYYAIKSIDKIPKFNCEIDTPTLYHYNFNNDYGFCVIKHK